MPPQPCSCTTAGKGPVPRGRTSVASTVSGAPGVTLAKRTVSRPVSPAQPARSVATITVAAIRCTARAYPTCGPRPGASAAVECRAGGAHDRPSRGVRGGGGRLDERRAGPGDARGGPTPLPAGIRGADAGPTRRGGGPLPALDRALPHRRGPHLPRLGVQLSGPARGRHRPVQDRDRGRSRLREPLQRHRRLPDRAGPGGGSAPLARAREAGAPLRAAALSVLQPGPHPHQAARDPGGDSRARGCPRAGAAVRDGPTGAAPAPRPAQLTSIPLPFYDNPLLFGHDATTGLLAFRPAESHVTVYARRDGAVVATEEPF